jgi:hypothetical protein
MANGVIGIPIAPCTVETLILATSRGSPKATRPSIVAVWMLDTKESIEIPAETLDPARHSDYEKELLL